MSDSDDDLEALREKNIADRKAYLKGLLKDIKQDVSKLSSLKKKRVYQKKDRTEEVVRTYNTRSRTKKPVVSTNNNFDEYDSDEVSGNERKYVKKHNTRTRTKAIKARSYRFDFEVDSEQDEQEQEQEKPRKLTKRSYYHDPSTEPSSDDSDTTKSSDSVVQKNSLKVNDTTNEDSCHQCGQKSNDTMAACKCGNSDEVASYFCDLCLKTKYGESVALTAEEPDWKCPLCRGICNCEICAAKNFKGNQKLLKSTANNNKESSSEHSSKEYSQSSEEDI